MGYIYILCIMISWLNIILCSGFVKNHNTKVLVCLLLLFFKCCVPITLCGWPDRHVLRSFIAWCWRTARSLCMKEARWTSGGRIVGLPWLLYSTCLPNTPSDTRPSGWRGGGSFFFAGVAVGSQDMEMDMINIYVKHEQCCKIHSTMKLFHHKDVIDFKYLH